MRRPVSLTLRLTLLFGFLAAIVFSGFGWFIERSIEHHFIAEDADELEVIARTVSQTLTSRKTVNNPTALQQRFNDILVGHHGAILYVTEQSGRTLFASNIELDFSKVIGNSTYNTVQTWSNANRTYRVLSRRLGDGNGFPGQGLYTMVVAVAVDGHQRFLDDFRHTLWLMIASGIVVTGLMGWFAVRQGHAPLHNIVAHIQRISASELNTRLSPETVPQELTNLAVSFNEMLERVEQAFLRLSNFSADIAHELRTPVTSLMTQTQVALSQTRNTTEYREILYSNIEEYERMAQMISDMLFLAKTDNGQYQIDAVDIDLTKESQDLFEYYEVWAEEREVSLVLQGSATVRGDRNILRRALGNLLSNAIKHSPPGSAVHVYLEQLSNRSVAITIENPGPAIPPEHVPRLFDRFYRVDASRKHDGEGVGLGLAIVKSIVDIHGGKIDVSSTEGCTRFRITIPKPLTA